VNNPYHSGSGGHGHPPSQQTGSPTENSFLARLGAWRGNAAASQTAPTPVHRSTKRLIISASRKGGVGKSFFLASLADWYRDLSIPFVAFDPDWCNGSLTRFVPQARFIDAAGSSAVDDIQNAFNEVDLVLLDGLGPLQGYLFEWLQDCDFLKSIEPKIEITFLVMVEEDKDSVFQAGEAARCLGENGHWVVVRNLKTCPTTEIYNSSDARQELIRLGAVEVQMDRVPWNLLLLIQKSGKTISGLSEDPSFSFLERQRMKSYQSRFFQQMETARHLLQAGDLPRTVDPPAPTKTPAPTPPARPRIAPERV